MTRTLYTLSRLLSIGFLLCACERRAPANRTAPIRVAAAADLSRAFEEIGRAFEARTSQPVILSFGASGLLARQLREGAPFDAFAAANVAFVDDAIASGACDGATKSLYARGHLTLWTPRGVEAPAALADLTDARFTRIAIANPEHAPYGQAAKQALTTAGLWSRLEPRLVFGQNVRQTLALAQSGNAEAALVATSLVLGDGAGASLAIDERLHAPLDQALVSCRRGQNAAGGEAFVRFVESEAGRAILQRYGLARAGEGMMRAP